MVGLASVPPVTVFPVKVSADGSEIVGFPEAPLPLATAISACVPMKRASLAQLGALLAEEEIAAYEARG